MVALKPNGIKNIIFDVGDVLIEYRWKDMLMDYGMSMEEAVSLGNKIFDPSLWNPFDLGLITEDELIAEYKMRYPKDIKAIDFFIRHGEYMHVPRPEIWDKVHKLKTMGYHIYLLSNYSECLFTKHTKGAPFMQDISGKVVSYQIHKMKPDKEIYQYLLDKYNLKANECVFFDDRPENTAVAEKLGIRTYTVTSRQYLAEMLSKWIEG